MAQSNTEVYLFTITPSENTITLTNQQNISNNDGYDNQPSFYNDNQVIFASTRNGQTDIASYNIRDKKVAWINDTGFGSEYSPTKIPNQKAISSIRLDTTGLQRLYRYDFKTGKHKEVVKDLVIGYHTWYSEDILISSVLADGGLDLVVSNLKEGTNYTQQKKIGRSLHKIPNSNLISYVSKENEKWEIKSLNPITGATQKIIETVPEAEDMCWLINGTILMPKGNIIYAFNPKTDTRWRMLTSFQDPNLYNITRVATNPTSSMLAIVSDISPEVIVQKQLDAYNARDIDAFLATYTNNIQLFDFPDKKTNEGKEELRKIFDAFFKRTPDLHAEIKNRIVIGNKVIDQEYITANGNNFSAVAIYEIQNGKISKVTFIR
ncbi:hypothetical protein GCM10011344_09490 [Dokdonia pacifica]|nr:hypothetical protein GCM10011344_09490 [Dokdonia pacifica]